MNTNEEVLNKVNNLPNNPGIYLFKDTRGRILYVGKARSLKQRVQSYFSAREKDPKTGELVSLVRDLETIQTDNELEALILESNLIKKYKPPYNISLRDDKHYPFLQLTMQEEYPRLKVVRKIKKDGSLYFGPYVPVRAMRSTLRLINKYFGLRQCRKKIEEAQKRPCLNFQMGRCLGPCSFHNSGEYDGAVEQVKLFLQGKKDTLTAMLTRDMYGASQRMEFEKAARIRDQLQDIQSMLSKQKIISNQMDDLDVYGFVREGLLVTIDVFHVRGGRILGRHSHRLNLNAVEDDALVLQNFITQYYLKETYFPEEILVPLDLPDAEVIAQWFSSRKGKRITIHRPLRGRKKEILIMTLKNTKISHMVRIQESDEVDKILHELKDQLQLAKIPRKIEGFDISNLQGSSAVGSMVVWENNRMIKSAYRRFRIKNVEGIDDYAMMAEILQRRFSRAIRESQQLPDLILIDGGLGHVNAASVVMKELDLASIDLIGMAKGRKQEESLKDRLFKPEKSLPAILSPHSQALHILQHIRDEAHRFAIIYHQKLRKKKSLRSLLDEIPGVGAKRKKLLIESFGSLKNLKLVSEEEIMKVKGLDGKTAHNVYRFLHEPTNPDLRNNGLPEDLDANDF